MHLHTLPAFKALYTVHLILWIGYTFILAHATVVLFALMHKFIIEKNGLFYCREEVALKNSIIEQHLKTEKHIRGKGKVARKEKREQDIAEALKLYYKDVCSVGETLSSDQRVYCRKVVRQVSRSKPNAQSYSFYFVRREAQD